MEKEELLKALEYLPKFEKQDIYTISDGNSIKQKAFKAIVPVGGNEAISVVGKDYKLIQFSETFKPIIEKLDNIEGEIYTYKGKAVAEIFPKEEEIGIVVLNSVDRTWSVRVNFICKVPNLGTVYIPRKVAGYRHVHRGDILSSYEQFSLAITEVKDAWKSIVGKMSEIEITDESMEELKEALKIGKRTEKIVKEIYTPGMKLWEFFVAFLKEISKKKYKSEIHRHEKMSKICSVIVSYALLTEA